MSNVYSEMFARSRKPNTYRKPNDLFDAAREYFVWCENHPLQEEKIFQHQGMIVRGDAERVRAFTKQGLAAHLGIPYSRLKVYKDRGGRWELVVELIENVIYTQKFENAAAGLLNSSLIARDLGIADKSELSGPDGGPMQTEDLTEHDAELFTSGITRLVAAIGARESVSGAPEENESGA